MRKHPRPQMAGRNRGSIRRIGRIRPTGRNGSGFRGFEKESEGCRGSLRPRADHRAGGPCGKQTLACIKEDGFAVIEFPFRPTAENFAAHFYRTMADLGYVVKRATVYETPTNSAAYEESGVR